MQALAIPFENHRYAIGLSAEIRSGKNRAIILPGQDILDKAVEHKAN